MLCILCFCGNVEDECSLVNATQNKKKKNKRNVTAKKEKKYNENEKRHAKDQNFNLKIDSGKELLVSISNLNLWQKKCQFYSISHFITYT